jgi:NAD(P)H-nitrite reductase large subunit
VKEIRGAGGRLDLSLSDGQLLAADLVISATGVTPSTKFLEGSGVACDDGVLVDERMQTNVAGVYAAGDVARAPEFGTGTKIAYAIQPTAVEEARVAALNMAGRDAVSPGGLAMNVLDTLGLISASFGQWHGVAPAQGGSSAELHDAERFRYLRLEFQDDRVIGATSLGHTDHVGVIRGLIQGRVRLGEWKAKLTADPSKLMDAYLARAQAVS